MNSVESFCIGNSDAAAQAAAVLRSGGVIAFPTETVYGLGADAENNDALRRIFSIKGRPADHPLIVHLPDVSLIDYWAREVPEAALRLAERFWPGPLTIVLRRSCRVSDLVTGGLDTVGIRVPAHPVAKKLLSNFGGGIAAPSANMFGRISPTCAEHVRDELGSAPDMILDGGDCQVGLESTIISMVGNRPVLLRPGAISLTELRNTLGSEVVLLTQPDPALRAPGSHASHYAPRTPAAVVATEDLPAVARRLGSNGQGVAILCITEAISVLCPTAVCVMMPGATDAYGRVLYASLRRLDAAGYDTILIEQPPVTDPWRVVCDRIRRAAHQLQ